VHARVTDLHGRDAIVAQLEALAAQGRTGLVFGPVGAGKTAILRALASRARASGRPSGMAPRVEGRGDVTRARAEAYPEAAAGRLEARAFRSRLRLAVEQAPGVLLLDGVVEASPPMRGFLRSLRGTGLGVVVAVDVEHPRDRVRARSFGLAHREIEIPRLHAVAMRRILADGLAGLDLPRPLVEVEHDAIVRAALGLPGKLIGMLRRLALPAYWHDGRPRLSLLRTDAGVALVGTLLRPPA
jgi:hypothetical protein